MQDLKKRKRDLPQRVERQDTKYNLSILVIVMICLLIVVGLVLMVRKTSQTPEEQTRTEAVSIEEIQQAEHEVKEVQAPEPIHYNIITLNKGDDYYEVQDIFARILHCENSNEVDGEEATWETGSVIMNRVADPNYPDNIVDVVTQSGQYDCLDNLYKENPTDIEYEIAADLMEYGSRSPIEVVFGAEFVQGRVYKKIGNTYYCYKN